MPNIIDTFEASYDAVIVGGRCAGAAAGLLLARAGLDVLVVEQGIRGTDTLSTHALMRLGVRQLSQWGFLGAIKAAGTPPIHTTTFHYGEEAVEVRIKPRDGVDALYAPRRTVLDPMLADAARAAGATVVYRTRLEDLRRDARGRVNGVVIESGGVSRSIGASIVVGADGVNSTVAKRTGVEPYRTAPHATSTIYARVRGLPPQGYHWHYVPDASVGVIPTNDGETIVFASVRPQCFMQRLRFDLAAGFHQVVQKTSPTLASSIAAADVGPYHGFAGHPGFFRPAWGPGWALVGDAGYFKDPVTAHGITDALRDAEILASAVLRGTDAALAEYQGIRDDLSVPMFHITDEIASFDWDLPRVQTLHKAFSDEMAREIIAVQSPLQPLLS